MKKVYMGQVFWTYIAFELGKHLVALLPYTQYVPGTAFRELMV